MMSLGSGYFIKPRKLFHLLVILFVSFDFAHCYYNQTFTPGEQCKRTCVLGETPQTCYFLFHIEFYTTVGPACSTPGLDQECVLADGFEKTILPINRQLPGPLIEVCQGDLVVVDVQNAAPGTEVTIHWHGLFQNGYQYYDGVPYITQCPIGSSTAFRYQFRVENAGTHFYHSHVSTFMLDGQTGGLIVRNPDDPHASLYDDERVIILNDWMHELSLERFPGRYRQNPGQAAENILINGLGNSTTCTKDPVTNNCTIRLTEIDVEPNKSYRIRIINAFSTVCLAEIMFASHRCTVIAQDGADVEPITVDTLVTSSGERVDCILTTNRKVDSYWIMVRGLGECQDTKVYQLAKLRYNGSSDTPSAPMPGYDDFVTGAIVTYNGLNATQCNTNITSPVLCVNQLESVEDKSDLLQIEPDIQHVMNFWFFNYTQYGDRLLFKRDNEYPEFFDAADRSQLISTFNDIAFESPSSPLISDYRGYQTVCRQNVRSTCTEPCTCTQVLPVPLGALVELVIYDSNQLDGLDHPFHLHGYEFCIFLMGRLKQTGNISRSDMDPVLREHYRRLELGLYENPPCKDTVKIPQGGYAIIRFRADNPGWWLIHCHFSWHHLTGMELVIRVGEQYQLPPKPLGFPECSNWTPAVHTLNNFYGFRYPQIEY